MIKFFRNIRQNLIMENKTSKYLKYAIGEIVLVVIGILIALQINNWNENQKSLKIEKNYLQRLINDVTSDTITLQNRIGLSKLRLEYGKELMQLVDGELNNYDPVDMLIKAQSLGRMWDPYFNTNTYQDLTSTGSFNLIRDKNISDSIRTYYSTIPYQWVVEFSKRRQEGVHPLMVDILPFNIHEEILKTDRLADYDTQYSVSLTGVEAESLIEQMRLQPQMAFELKNVTRSHLINTQVLVGTKERGRRLILLLRDYLERIN